MGLKLYWLSRVSDNSLQCSFRTSAVNVPVATQFQLSAGDAGVDWT